jgi:hypothetical protein
MRTILKIRIPKVLRSSRVPSQHYCATVKLINLVYTSISAVFEVQRATR